MSANGAKDKSDYKVVVSDLGVCPFRRIRIAFALMAIIPILVIFYIVLGKYFLFQVVLGNDALTLCIAILISLTGLYYAYSTISSMIDKLIKYAAERKLADHEKTELMIAVSHDLKTPLTTVKMGLCNIADLGEQAPASTVKMMVSYALRAVDRMGDLINQILDFPKVGFSRANIKREFIDLDQVLRKEIEAVSDLVTRSDIEFEYDSTTDNADIWADKNKMSRVVSNLLSNAIKYTPRGGKIRMELSSDDYTVRFSVANSGPGISPEEIDRIFAKYERLEKHSHIEGTGIGLSIVKDIIDLHDGKIAVTSEPDKETEFKVILPRDLRSAAEAAKKR